MRIGLVIPRINGIGVGAGVSPEQVIGGILSDWQRVGPSISCPAPSPATVRANLTQQAQSTCIDWPTLCQNGIPTTLIEQAVSYYSDMVNWNGTKAANCPDDAVNGYAPSQQPGYVPPAQAPPSQPNTPNALNTAAPQPTIINQAPQGNVLSPPQGNQPVSGSNAGSFTGTPTTSNGPGDLLSGTVDIGGFSIPTLALLVAAGFGLYMMGRK